MMDKITVAVIFVMMMGLFYMAAEAGASRDKINNYYPWYSVAKAEKEKCEADLPRSQSCVITAKVMKP